MSTIRRRVLVLAAVIAVAAALRLFRLGHQSFWIDEMLTAGAYSKPPGGIPYWKKLLWDVHGPLYSLIMHFWSAAGSSEAWLRLPGVIAGTLSVFFFYRWMSSFASWSTATAGALILALSPFHIYYSQEMRFYSLLFLMLVLSMIAFKRFLDDPSVTRGSVLGITLGLACLSHFMALFLCAGLLLYMLSTGRARGAHLRFGLLAALITLVIVSPWIYRQIYFLRQIEVTSITGLTDEEKLRGELTLNVWVYPYSLYAFSTGYSFGPDLWYLQSVRSPLELLRDYWWALAAVLAVFVPLGVSGLVRSRKAGVLDLFVSIMLVTVVSVTVAAFLNVKVFNARYLFCFFPVYLAILALGLPGRGRARVASLAAVAVLMVVSDWNYFMVDRYARDDMRGAVEIIADRERPGDLILVPCGSSVFEHYYRGVNRIVDYSPLFIGDRESSERLERQLASYGRVWYVECRPWVVDPRGVFPRVLEHSASQAAGWRLPGILLQAWETGGGGKLQLEGH